MKNYWLLFSVAIIISATQGTLFAAEYQLKPGDVLEIRIAGKGELTTKQPITPDGTISLPTVGRISLDGKTLNETDALLKRE